MRCTFDKEGSEGERERRLPESSCTMRCKSPHYETTEVTSQISLVVQLSPQLDSVHCEVKSAELSKALAWNVWCGSIKANFSNWNGQLLKVGCPTLAPAYLSFPLYLPPFPSPSSNASFTPHSAKSCRHTCLKVDKQPNFQPVLSKVSSFVNMTAVVCPLLYSFLEVSLNLFQQRKLIRTHSTIGLVCCYRWLYCM
jgi:hypothetical protein